MSPVRVSSRRLVSDTVLGFTRQLRQTLGMRGFWKWVGAGRCRRGVAGGVLVARDQRRRNAYTPEDIRARLHKRVAEAGSAD